MTTLNLDAVVAKWKLSLSAVIPTEDEVTRVLTGCALEWAKEVEDQLHTATACSNGFEKRVKLACADRDQWKARAEKGEVEVKACLDLEPSSVRVREGGAGENIYASLAVTMASMRHQLSKLKEAKE